MIIASTRGMPLQTVSSASDPLMFGVGPVPARRRYFTANVITSVTINSAKNPVTQRRKTSSRSTCTALVEAWSGKNWNWASMMLFNCNRFARLSPLAAPHLEHEPDDRNERYRPRQADEVHDRRRVLAGCRIVVEAE